MEIKHITINTFQLPQNFPPELWIIIYGHVDIVDKTECRLVCKEWQSSLDSIKNPEWWSWFMVNTTVLVKSNKLAIQWAHDHVYKVSTKLLTLDISLPFAEWILDNAKCNRRDYLNLLNVIIDQIKSIKLVEKIFERIRPSKKELVNFGVCSELGLFEKRDESVLGPPHPETFNIVEYFANEYNIESRSINDKLAAAACASEDVENFVYYDDIANSLIPMEYRHCYADILKFAMSASSTKLLDAMRDEYFADPRFLNCVAKYTLSIKCINVLERLLLTFIDDLSVKQSIYINTFMTMFATLEDTPSNLETLKRCNLLAKNPVIPIHKLSRLHDPILRTTPNLCSEWLCSQHEFTSDARSTDLSISVVLSFAQLSVSGIISFKNVARLLNLAQQYLKSRIKYGEIFIYAAAASNELIEYLWDRDLLSKQIFDKGAYFLRLILSKTSKERIDWLYANRPFPIIDKSDVDGFLFESGFDWRTLKRAHERGMFDAACERLLIRKLFGFTTNRLALEWCYQNFEHVIGEIYAADCHISSWFSYRFLNAKSVNNVTKTQSQSEDSEDDIDLIDDNFDSDSSDS